MKTCKRCKLIYRTEKKYSRYCENCHNSSKPKVRGVKGPLDAWRKFLLRNKVKAEDVKNHRLVISKKV